MKARRSRARAISMAMTTCAIGLVAACAPQRTSAPDCGAIAGEPRYSIQLLFGRNIGTQGEVSDEEWRDFMATTITPAFPDGLTVFDAQGQWRDAATGMLLSERSKIVFLMVGDVRAASPQVAAIADAYKTRFKQDAVAVMTTPACAAFR